MGADDDPSAAAALSREQCLARLSEASVGRIGVSIDALPVILPIHFALSGDSILFFTSPGSRLEAATTGAVVAFQADAPDPIEGGWWSVLLQGIATPATGRDTEAYGRLRNVGAWAGSRPTATLLRLGTQKMTGRRFPGMPTIARVGRDDLP